MPQDDEGPRTTLHEISAMVGGVIGACTFAVTDSFWFNAVEAEVYAGSIPGVGTDVLIVVGTEPQLRWRTYCQELTEIALGEMIWALLRAALYAVAMFLIMLAFAVLICAEAAVLLTARLAKVLGGPDDLFPRALPVLHRACHY